ncbi:TPT-domain-containing protein [Myriangium duriaei CBS 260.36]|uniref:TPT-domain-containing protein n=1 Tax=Myriangium duriaei CBS 260.36 TaxID=1168546 RepID=A0A9P4J9Z9_9PEZI|nr:TPT-domain-containing protein [Myriangium duriaei CBS 260.36]
MEKERKSIEAERPGSVPVLPTVNPATEKPAAQKSSLHPAFYIATWISLSSGVIIFNKWILHTAKFEFPIILTTWHLGFATLMTQLMARFTTMLDGRKKVPMTGRVYLRAIVPIGLMFSLSLICGNLTYLYLSVSFIQMLKATTPVAVLLATWTMGVAPPNMKTLGNVSFIVLGVIIASVGEIKFQLTGFLFQIAGIVFEAIRLTMVQRLLSSEEYRMDPLVSLYYFAPACAVMNGVTALLLEVPKVALSDFERVGYFNLLANAMVAFALNVSVVFLIGKTSSLVLTLSGVLKDVLLVVASMVIFRDPVSGLQFFGYSIALGGLLYYKLGSDKLKEYFSEGNRQWADYGNRSPIVRKLLTIGIVIVTIIMLLGGIGSMFPGYVKENATQLSSKIGSKWGSDN